MKAIKYITISAIILIAIFVNANQDTAVWDLVFWLPIYMLLFVAFSIIWIVFDEIITRSSILSLGLCFAFQFFMDLVKIFNRVKFDDWNNTNIANIVLGISIIISFSVYPIYIKYIKRPLLTYIKKLRR